jgi:TIR domain
MIFVSYSRKDEAWRKRFLVMAKPLARYQSIKFWSDRDIPAGMDWRAEIRQAMNDALVAVTETAVLLYSGNGKWYTQSQGRLIVIVIPI